LRSFYPHGRGHADFFYIDLAAQFLQQPPWLRIVECIAAHRRSNLVVKAALG
jgi:hypothetical protein